MPRDRDADRRLRNILGLDTTDGEHPLDSYDIGCDEGAWNAFLRKLWCGTQAYPFSIGKWAVGVGTEVMDWALSFRVAEALTPVAGLLSRVYDVSLVGPLGVRHLAWTLTVIVAGWHLLRARLARGASEMATTFVIAIVGGFLVANPQGYLEGSMTLARNTSGAVLEAVDQTLGGTGEPNSQAVRERLGAALRQAFVAEPYDLVNWGGPLSGPCADAREEILAGGPWGSDDRPRQIMRDHGCSAEADYNAKPSDSRAAASLIVALAAVGASILLVLIALVVVVAQLTLVALFAGASIVWALAMAPGARGLASWWLSRLAWAVTATVGATFVLSWLTVSVTAVLAASRDLPIVQRCLVALLVVVFGFRLRGYVGRAVDHASNGLRGRVGPSGQRGHSGVTVAAAGAAGFGIASTARSWATDLPGGQYTYNRLYARHFTRGMRARRGPLRRARSIVGTVNRAGEGAANLSVRGVRTGGRLARTARRMATAPGRALGRGSSRQPPAPHRARAPRAGRRGVPQASTPARPTRASRSPGRTQRPPSTASSPARTYDPAGIVQALLAAKAAQTRPSGPDREGGTNRRTDP